MAEALLSSAAQCPPPLRTRHQGRPYQALVEPVLTDTVPAALAGEGTGLFRLESALWLGPHSSPALEGETDVPKSYNEDLELHLSSLPACTWVCHSQQASKLPFAAQGSGAKGIV